jgi:hypothetical protein
MGNIHMPAGTVTHTGEGNAAANVRSLRSSRGGNPTVSVQGKPAGGAISPASSYRRTNKHKPPVIEIDLERRSM